VEVKGSGESGEKKPEMKKWLERSKGPIEGGGVPLYENQNE
jgi:hypothetical protein